MDFPINIEQRVMEWQGKVDPNYVTYRLTYPRDTPQAQAVNVMWSLAGVQMHRNQAFVYETYGNDKGWWQYLSVAPKLAPGVEQQFRTGIPGLHVARCEEDITTTEWDDGMELGLSDMYRPLRLGEPSGAVASMLSHFTPLGPGEALLLQWVFIGARTLPKKAPRRPWPFKQVDEKIYTAKVGGHTFMAVARVAAKGPNPSTMLKRVGTAFHSLRAENVVFKDRRIPWPMLKDRIIERSVPMNYPIHLTDLEMATVLPIPFGGPNVPGMAQSRTRAIWADDSVPRHGFIVGNSTWPGAERVMAFDAEEALQHTHYEGPTRVGKSNAMEAIALQQMEAGHGVGFLDPTGDAIEDLMCRIPENRWDDVILIDPTDTDFPVGINVFDGAQDPSVRADQLMSIIAGIYKDNGIYVSNYLRAAIQALASVPGSTLVDVPAFMKDADFRGQIIDQVDDSEIVRMWRDFERLRDSEKENRIAPALHRVQPLLMRPSVRLTLGQSKNALDFGQILRAGKILLVSIPKGRIGDDTAILIGSCIVSRLWQEAQGRARNERKPYFYLHIDEAPNFLNMPTSLDTVFSEASKYGLGLAVANQHEGQWPGQTRAAIHANTRNKLMFKVSIDDAMIVARTMGVTPEDVLSLGKYEAIMRTPNGAAATVRTKQLPPPSVTAAAIRARSRRGYGRPRAEVDHEQRERYRGSRERQRPPIGRQED